MEATGAQSRTPACSNLQSERRGARKVHGCGYVRTLRRAAICAVAIAFGAGSVLAQESMPPGSTPPFSRPTQTFGTFGPEPSGLAPDPFDMPLASMPMPAVDVSREVSAESCNTWTEAAVRSPTVSVARLAVPGNARSEFRKACGALKDKRLAQAEAHARKAIERYANYAAAWVVLGQVLDAQHKRDEARTACAQALNIDPGYSPPYICLAEFAARANDWEQVSKFSKRALELNPVNNAYTFYYAAVAALHFKQLSEAELDGLSAANLDTWHHFPQIHFLLAKVYEAKGDGKAESAQLREYLKMVPNAPDSASAKAALAKLKAQRAN
jgi:Tetratricopeptide repeat